MAFDAFMQIEGIKGESQDAKHKDWIELKSFNHGIHQPASASASSVGGATAERVNHGDFVVEKLMDLSTPKLLEFCCTGQHIKTITIELCRAGGDKQKYMEIKMEQAIISKVDSAGTGIDPANPESFPLENVSINYGKIKWTYVAQKRADGQGGGQVAAGWDRITNKKSA